MKNRKATIMILLIVLTLGKTAFSQDNPVKFANFNKFKEKINLQTDRNLYLTGEDIHLSARYLLNGTFQQGQISNVLYVELMNEKFEPIVQKKLQISNGKSNGKLRIPETENTGRFYIRGYTQYQRNLGKSNFSYHLITVVNPDIPPSSYHNPNKKGIQVLSNEASCNGQEPQKTTFILSDSIVNSVKSLQILNVDNEVTFETNNIGNGLCYRDTNPTDSSFYQLILLTTHGDTISKNISELQDNIIYASIYKQNDNIEYSLCNKNNINTSRAKLEVYSSDFKKVFQKSTKSNNESIHSLVPYNKLKFGLNYFVLRDTNNKIRNITAFFNGYNSENSIEISTNKKAFHPREEVELKLQKKGEPQQPVHSSVAVSRIGTNERKDNIIPRSILMNPNLLENYIIKTGPLSLKQKKQVEASMMIYSKKINNKDFYQLFSQSEKREIKHIPEIRNVTISGLVRNKKTKEPIANKKLFTSVLFNNKQVHITKTNDQGKFIVSLKDIEGKNDIYLYPDFYFDEKPNLEILINNKFSNQSPEFENVQTNINKSDLPLIKEMIINKQIKNLSVESKINKTDKTKKEHFSFFQDMATTNLADYIEFKKMKDVFNEIIPYVFVRKSKDKYKLLIKRDGYTAPGQALVLLDNIPIFDLEKIMNLHPSQIKSIGVSPKPYILGNHTLNSVVMIKSKKENFANIEFPNGSTFLQYQGLAPDTTAKKIETIDSDPSNKRKPNFRTTLYWNPDITIAPESKNNYSFFVSDRKGKYQIIVSGINQEGEYFFGKETISVE